MRACTALTARRVLAVAAYKSVDEMRRNLASHVVAPVQWQASIELLLAAQYRTVRRSSTTAAPDDARQRRAALCCVRQFYEVGCGGVLTGLTKHIARGKALEQHVRAVSVSIASE